MSYVYQKADVSFKKITDIGQEGRNSEVFIAHDEYLDADIVVKEVRLKDESIEHYLEEAKILYRSNHPNVVQIHYCCRDDGHLYVAMPYYRNGSLKSLMATRHLTVQEIIKYSVNFLNGLHNIHSKGLIHFDIKPDNILISNQGEALVSDFGQAAPMDEDGCAQQGRIYNKHWAPETFGSSEMKFDNRYDIYQAGLTLYRMCNGDAHFDDQVSQFGSAQDFAKAIRAGTFPDRKAYLPHIPPKLCRVINKCLQPHPGKRYGSVIEVINAIADIDGSTLHWLYEVADNGTRSWTRKEGASKRILTVTADGTGEAYTLNFAGKKRRVMDYCKASISLDEMQRFLNT